MSIEIIDLDFVDLPVIRLLSRGKANGNRTPHLIGPDGMLCYVARNSTVLDRYDPGGTVLRCLLQAEKVLGDGLRGRSDIDFVDEFANYWGAGPAVLIDLPPDFVGEAEIFRLALTKERETELLSTKAKLAGSFRAKHASNRGASTDIPSSPCTVVSVSRDLGSNWRGSALPQNLKELSQFLEEVGKPGVVETALRNGNGLDRWIAVRASNASCLAAIRIPKMFDRAEFMKSRKAALPQLLLSKAEEITVERYSGFPIDEEFLYQRNLGGIRSFAGKRIVLIGCGTIGGFLALSLAQSGAGTSGGLLTLIDREVLMPSNLGRHLLGIPFLNVNKAEGCAEHIRSQLPHVNVISRPIDVRPVLESLSAHLIIDATGEEAFSIALNHRAVAMRPSFPPVLYSWIAGNGGAAQALFCDSPEYACFKCQKPELAGKPRHRVLRQESENDLRRNPACGDGLYAPFPVSASMATAALALDLALAWNNGDPVHRFRTRVIDGRRCNRVNDMNLSISPVCPACGTLRR